MYLVSVAEVSAVRNVVRQLEYLNRKDIAREKVRVVLNRHHARNVVSDTLSSSEVTRSLEAWASEIGKKPGTELKKKTGGGLLSFWNR